MSVIKCTIWINNIQNDLTLLLRMKQKKQSKAGPNQAYNTCLLTLLNNSYSNSDHFVFIGTESLEHIWFAWKAELICFLVRLQYKEILYSMLCANNTYPLLRANNNTSLKQLYLLKHCIASGNWKYIQKCRSSSRQSHRSQVLISAQQQINYSLFVLIFITGYILDMLH